MPLSLEFLQALAFVFRNKPPHIWTGIGYPVYASYLQGGMHKDFESFNKAMRCLDDGTGDLIKYGPPMSNLAMGKADTVGNATKTFNVTEAGNWGIVRVAPGHPD